MKAAILALLLATAAAAQPLMTVGGDGHAYITGEGAVLYHAHDGVRREIGIPPIAGMLPGRAGVWVSAGDRVWLVVEGKATEIATGTIVEVAEATDGTWLYVWRDGALVTIYVP